MADQFQSDRLGANAEDSCTIFDEVQLQAGLLEGTPRSQFRPRKLIDHSVTADTWEGLVTEVKGQTYRVAWTFFPNPTLHAQTPPNNRKMVRFTPTWYRMEWKGVERPLFLQIVGTVNQKDGWLSVLEARLLMPIDLNRETIIERQVAVHEGSTYLKDQSDDVWEEAIAFFSQIQYEGGKYNPHDLAWAEDFLRLNEFHVEWEAGKRACRLVDGQGTIRFKSLFAEPCQDSIDERVHGAMTAYNYAMATKAVSNNEVPRDVKFYGTQDEIRRAA